MSCKPTYKGKRYNSIEELKSANSEVGQQLSFFSLSPKSKLFNKNVPGLKTVDNKLELEEEISNKVTDRIKQLLRDANIRVESIEAFIEKMKEIQPQTDFSGVLGIADILNKIIAIENFKELPEDSILLSIA